jgi:uncharacterized RDD family membrane protein YckC
MTPHSNTGSGSDRSPDPSQEGVVLGLDNVALTLPIAGIGSRVLAGTLDYLLQSVIQFVWLLVLGGSMLLGGAKGGWALGIYIAGVFVIDWGYFAGSEIFFSQRTPGKRAVHLRVVTREGGTPSVASLLIRNLVRLVDLVVGVPLIALDPLGRRLGDRLAGTLVVHDADRPALILRRIPDGWGPSDIAVVESLLERTAEMEPARVEYLSQRLLDSLRRQHPGFLEGVEPGPTAAETLRRAFLAEPG